MASFSGITIREKGQGNGQGFPVWSKAGVIVLKKIPSSGDSVIQKIGIAVARLAMPVRVTASQLTSLYGVVGTDDTLIFHFETATAKLESITNVEEFFHGQDAYTATLNLIRLASVSTTPSGARVTEAGDIRVTEAGDIRITE